MTGGTRLTLLTHVTDYAGPGALAALLAEGHRVACHDPSFAAAPARTAFEAAHPNAVALAAQDPAAIAEEAVARCGLPDAVICNDVHPITRNPIEAIPLHDLRATFEAVVLAPIRLTQALLPAMKARGRGSFVFVTSARETRPEPGCAVPTTLRAATTAFAKALAKEAAPFGIQANVVAPNYLYSEAYYPRARYVDDPDGQAEIARTVPMGRLGEPEEVGALIAFLASGRSTFTTGQVVHFTGGWP